MNLRTSAILFGLGVLASACVPQADAILTNTPSIEQHVEITEIQQPTPAFTQEPTLTPSIIPEPTLTPTLMPAIEVSAYSPNDDSPLEDLVILRGDEHLLDPSASASGGVGALSAFWDINNDGVAESTEMDPDPFNLEPGAYDDGLLVISDQAGQSVQIDLPRVVKVGEPEIPDYRFGAHENFSWWHPVSMWDEVMSMMKETGVEIIRVGYNWDFIEPEDDKWEFSLFDKLTEKLNSHGIPVMAIAAGTPKWANTTVSENVSNHPPTDMNEYAEYVGKLVERYDGDGYNDAQGSPIITVVQIWNEPNIHWFWEPNPDPEKYAEMLNKAYLTAKYANPDIIVLGGGLVGNGVETTNPGEYRGFLQESYDSTGAFHFDVLGIHPYSHPTQEGINSLISKIQSARYTLDTNGGTNIPIWLDEFGWPNSDDSMTWGRTNLSDETIARWIEQVYTNEQIRSLCGPIFWHSFTDHKDSPGVFFGLVTEDLIPKPQFIAYKEISEEIK